MDSRLVASVYPHPFDNSRHDSSATVLKINLDTRKIDDVFAYEEAKCNSEKNFGRGYFPDRSLFLGLKHFGCRPSDIDVWVFPTPPSDVGVDHLWRFFKLLDVIDEEAPIEAVEDMIESGRVRFFPHYLLHAGVASFTSPFSEGYFFTLDGGGDGGDPNDISFGKFVEGEGLFPSFVHSPKGPNITRFHDRVTELLGFDVQDNGKTNGISSYGSYNFRVDNYFSQRESLDQAGLPIYEFERDHRTPVDASRIRLDKYSITKVLFPSPGSLKMIRDLSEESPIDIAATAEKRFSETIIDYVLRLLPETGKANLALGGGAFNNVILNGALARTSSLRCHFSMAPGDSGLSLGGALIVAAEFGCHNWQNPLLGPEFSDDEFEDLLEEYGISAKRDNNSFEIIDDLVDGRIVGVFRGRAEYGPRSLGARSILGDPRKPAIKSRVNHYVKRRDFFMPFAPAILEEHIDDFLENSWLANDYMQVAAPVMSGARETIPAAVHVDGTARVQKVSKTMYPELHNLVSRFNDRTGVPALLNTSFNRHGISTISSPRQALEHLLAGSLDSLYFGPFYLRFEDVRTARSKKSPSHESEHELINELVNRWRSKASEQKPDTE